MRLSHGPSICKLLGTGIDAVEIDRFAHWHAYTKTQLLRVFSQEEIDYCLQIPVKSAERFAARFAAKEATYKAACSLGIKNISFFAFCKIISVDKRKDNCPVIKINSTNTKINEMLDSVKISLSITHTKTLAIASIIIY